MKIRPILEVPELDLDRMGPADLDNERFWKHSDALDLDELYKKYHSGSRVRQMAMLIQTTAREYESKVPTLMRRNPWIRLFLLTGIDTRWQRNAWMKICEKTQTNLDRDNAIWLWGKSELKNL